MQHKKLISTIIITALLIIPLISAAWGSGYWSSYRSPLDYLENEWVMFIILFLVFFAVIFYTLNKTMKNNVVAGVIALGFSLFISLAIARKGLLWGYGQGIDSWILLVALLIGFAFLIRFAAESFGTPGAMITAFVIWLLLNAIGLEAILPYALLNSSFSRFFESILSFWGLLIILALAFALSRGVRKTVKEVGEMMDKAVVRMRR